MIVHFYYRTERNKSFIDGFFLTICFVFQRKSPNILIDKSRFRQLQNERYYRKNSVWNLVMLFSNVVFNVFTDIFDVTTCI